jgi:hypothetical protein
VDVFVGTTDILSEHRHRFFRVWRDGTPFSFCPMSDHFPKRLRWWFWLAAMIQRRTVENRLTIMYALLNAITSYGGCVVVGMVSEAFSK